jgi:WD40 repeat protein/tRNA A-37 threonylcarbamoyl transferase component Bud32
MQRLECKPGDQEFEHAVAAYFDAREAGAAVDPQALFAAFPDRTEELAQALAEYETDRPGTAPERDSGSSPPLPPPPTERSQPIVPHPPCGAGGVREERFGDYELIQEIARGGMGIVFKARQRSLNRIVALKMIRGGGISDAEQVRRFRAEAEAAARLQHPHIVAVHEVGEHNGQHFFTMDFVDGRSLSDLLRAEAPSVRESVRCVATIAGAIQYAHTQGVLHRDLKPSNVIVDGEGRPRITDFGLCRRLDVDSDLTATGQVLGTPSYMSPEQARGEQTAVGAPSDVYALGAMLYELLCGRPLFRAETAMETLRQVIDAEPLPPRALNPSVNRDLETICLKCLQKEPGRRYRTAGELAEDLQRYVDGRPIMARRIGPAARVWRWCRRRPTAAAALGATAVAAIVTVAASIGYGVQQSRFAAQERLHARELGKEQAETQQALVQVEEQRRVAEKRGMELSRQLAENHLDTGQRLCEQGDVHRGLLHLARALTLVPDNAADLDRTVRRNLSAWSWEAMPLLRFTRTEGVVREFSADGRFALQSGGRAGSALWDVALDRSIGAQHPVWDVGCAVVATDGRLVAEADVAGQVRVWTPTGGPVAGSPLQPSARVIAMAISPQGDVLLTSTAKGIQRWDAATLAPLGEVITYTFRSGGTEVVVSVPALAFSPDGEMFAACGPEVSLYGTASGALIGRSAADNRYPVQCAAFSPDGRILATGGIDGALRLWDVRKVRDSEADSYAAAPLTLAGGVYGLAFSADGRRLVSRTVNGVVQLWDPRQGLPAGPPVENRPSRYYRVSFVPGAEGVMIPGTGTVQVRQAPQAGERVPALRQRDLTHGEFSLDGSRILAMFHRQAKLFDVAAGRLLPFAFPLERDYVDAAISGDHRFLATGEMSGILNVWKADDDSSVVGTLRFRQVNAARFSPDAKMLAVAGDDQVRFWDVERRAESGPPLKTVGPELVFTPDGATLVVGTFEGRVEFWDVTARRLRTAAAGHTQRLSAIACSADGTVIATGCRDGTARAWDARQRVPSGPLLRHPLPVRLVRLSPDGEVLATVCGTEVRLWNTRTGKRIGPVLRHPAEVGGLFIDSRAQELLTLSHGIWKWPLPRAIAGDPGRLESWIEVVTGLEFAAGGEVQVLEIDQWHARQTRLEELGGPPLD